MKLFDFIDESPSCYHAIQNIAASLDGFIKLNEEEEWNIERGKSYYVIRNDSSIIAFRIPDKGYTSVRIAASHSDSPTFKIKPAATVTRENKYVLVNTEKYGGMIMYSWLDRPLSLAGRVRIKGDKGFETRLVNIDKDLMIIPSVAIHMNRNCNDGYRFDPQVDLLPLLADAACVSEKQDFIKTLVAECLKIDADRIYGMDIFLYNRVKCTYLGANNEFVAGRALDDLECAYCNLMGFLTSKANENALSVYTVFDNEEVGSMTGNGADSTFLTDVLERIESALGYSENHLKQAVAKGYMISADNAHGVHPNHPEYADPTNRPLLNAGIVIKHSANQKYTTNAYSEGMFRYVCENANVPVQEFANKSNIAGGSTLGNISNSHLSIKTVDIGLPQLAMHSAYETAGAKDVEYLINAVKSFYEIDL